MRRLYGLGVCALLSSVSACSNGYYGAGSGSQGPVGTTGELGNGTFFYQCVDDSDPVCDDGDSDFPFDSSFATHSTLGMSYRQSDGGSGLLESSASDRLRASGSVFIAERAGHVAILARGGGRVLDVLHIQIDDMASLAFDTDSFASAGLDEGMLEMAVRARLPMRALPLNEDGDVLSGALPMEWQSGDLSVVSFDGSSRDNDVQLVANRAGVVDIFVTMGDISRTLTVTVTGDPPLVESQLAISPSFDIFDSVAEESP